MLQSIWQSTWSVSIQKTEEKVRYVYSRHFEACPVLLVYVQGTDTHTYLTIHIGHSIDRGPRFAILAS